MKAHVLYVSRAGIARMAKAEGDIKNNPELREKRITDKLGRQSTRYVRDEAPAEQGGLFGDAPTPPAGPPKKKESYEVTIRKRARRGVKHGLKELREKIQRLPDMFRKPALRQLREAQARFVAGDTNGASELGALVGIEYGIYPTGLRYPKGASPHTHANARYVREAAVSEAARARGVQALRNGASLKEAQEIARGAAGAPEGVDEERYQRLDERREAYGERLSAATAAYRESGVNPLKARQEQARDYLRRAGGELAGGNLGSAEKLLMSADARIEMLERDLEMHDQIRELTGDDTLLGKTSPERFDYLTQPERIKLSGAIRGFRDSAYMKQRAYYADEIESWVKEQKQRAQAGEGSKSGPEYLGERQNLDAAEEALREDGVDREEVFDTLVWNLYLGRQDPFEILAERSGGPHRIAGELYREGGKEERHERVRQLIKDRFNFDIGGASMQSFRAIKRTLARAQEQREEKMERANAPENQLPNFANEVVPRIADAMAQDPLILHSVKNAVEEGRSYDVIAAIINTHLDTVLGPQGLLRQEFPRWYEYAQANEDEYNRVWDAVHSAVMKKLPGVKKPNPWGDATADFAERMEAYPPTEVAQRIVERLDGTPLADPSHLDALQTLLGIAADQAGVDAQQKGELIEAARRAVMPGSTYEHDALKRYDGDARSRYIYASPLRPLGSWATELYDDGREVLHTDGDPSLGEKAHAYIYSEDPLPPSYLDRFQLELVRVPDDE